MPKATLETNWVLIPRYSPDPQWETLNTKISSIDAIEEFLGKDPDNNDTISIFGSRPTLLTNHYATVETVNLRNGAFTVLQAASLAASLAVSAKNYSTCMYMCMFNACAFREMSKALVAPADILKVVRGSAYNKAGKVGSLAFVTPEAELVLKPVLEVKEQLRTALGGKLGLLHEGTVQPLEEVYEQLKADSAQWDKLTKNAFKEQLKTMFDTQFASNVQAAQEKEAGYIRLTTLSVGRLF
ncbi:hypothetical protein C8F01DRAFT_381675 [Mycena amicta]|nr:hypothetical protein C8F01DRAFT_381675 [Mycena amicta]